jgi:GNAT superfamily N-acetyltransferase
MNNKNITLIDINLDEISSFYSQLTYEKKHFPNPLQAPLELVIGIKEGNELVGMGGLKRQLGCLYFAFFVVKSDFRRRGIGLRIMSAILDYSRKKKLWAVFGTVQRENQIALKADLAIGYRVIYKTDVNYRLGLPFNFPGIIICKIAPFMFMMYLFFQKIRGIHEE